jgi:FkbM family methyltransferase
MSDFKDWENRLYPSIVDNIDYIIYNTPISGVFYDIGANTGLLSEKVHQKRPDITYILFEPVKKYYDNIVNRFKNFDNVKVLNYALIDREEDIPISVDGNNLGWNTISEIREYGDKELVKGTTLFKAFIQERLPIPDFIKIDVEESEHLVIKGAEPFFKRHVPDRIYIECGIPEGHSLWNKQVDMFEYLFSLGYKRFDYNLKETFDAKFEL